jgi:plasmid stability protein
MKQLTVRGFDEELEKKLEETARAKGISLSRAAVELMRKGAGLRTGGKRTDVVGDALNEFIGSWSEAEVLEILRAIEPFERIDEAFWR